MEDNKDIVDKKTISSFVPNLRFGASYLDTKFRDRAAFGESLLDKRTGEVVHKRKTDGSLLYYDRESPKTNDYIIQIASILKADNGFTYPTTAYEEAETTDLITALFDTQDFYEDFITDDETYELGNKKKNNSDEPFSMSKYVNGIIIKACGRPRDIALLNYYSKLFNDFISNYTGYEEDLVKYKEAYKNDPTFKDATVEIGYTVKAYKGSTKSLEFSKVAYLRMNEYTLLSFADKKLESFAYSYLTFHIDYYKLPKVRYMEDRAKGNLSYKKQFDILIDDATTGDKIADITHIYACYFDDYNNIGSKLPDPVNSRIISSLPVPALETFVKELCNVSLPYGVHVSPMPPDTYLMNQIKVWIERFREVKNKGETEDEHDPPYTNFKELEQFFGEGESIRGQLTDDYSKRDGNYFVEYRGSKNAGPLLAEEGHIPEKQYYMSDEVNLQW